MTVWAAQSSSPHPPPDTPGLLGKRAFRILTGISKKSR
jgi:hypothetical protein